MIQYFLLTLAVAAAGGLIGYKLKLPVGGMVGSMIAVIIFNVVTEKAVFYSELRIALQIFGGAMIGSQIGRDDLLAMKKIIFPTVLLLLSMVVLNLTFGTLMYVFSDLDLATALFASTPGGVSDMAIISADLGANPAYVAIIQLCRLLTIFIFMPPIFRKIISSRNNMKDRNNALETADANPEECSTPNQTADDTVKGDNNKAKVKLNAKRFILMLVIAAAGGVLLHLLDIAAGAMIGAMISAASFCIFLGRMPFPLTLRLGMQIFSGAFIGIGLDRSGLDRMGDLGVPLLILVVGIFIFVFLVTLLLHKVAGLDLITSMLSSTPGGVQEMALLSEDIGGDTPKIAVMQTARLISVILFFPLMLQLILGIIG